VRVLAAALAAVSLHCAAAPFAVQVGEARIGLDAPPGFADTGFTGSPRLQEIAESLTSASNRILLFAISDGDLRKFTLGDPPEFRRYMIAVTPKALERERFDRSRFDDFARAALRDLGEPVPAGKTGLLQELRRDPEVVSVLVGGETPPQSRSHKPHYVLSTMTLMLVRGKALSLAVYGAYETPSDFDWIRAITARWIEDLQRLNAR
jgi:hypothetical protein